MRRACTFAIHAGAMGSAAHLIVLFPAAVRGYSALHRGTDRVIIDFEKKKNKSKPGFFHRSIYLPQ